MDSTDQNNWQLCDNDNSDVDSNKNKKLIMMTELE